MPRSGLLILWLVLRDEIGLEHSRRQIPKSGVQPSAIVYLLQKVSDAAAGMIKITILFQPHLFGL